MKLPYAKNETVHVSYNGENVLTWFWILLVQHFVNLELQ